MLWNRNKYMRRDTEPTHTLIIEGWVFSLNVQCTYGMIVIDFEIIPLFGGIMKSNRRPILRYRKTSSITKSIAECDCLIVHLTADLFRSTPVIDLTTTFPIPLDVCSSISFLCAGGWRGNQVCDVTWRDGRGDFVFMLSQSSRPLSVRDTVTSSSVPVVLYLHRLIVLPSTPNWWSESRFLFQTEMKVLYI